MKRDGYTQSSRPWSREEQAAVEAVDRLGPADDVLRTPAAVDDPGFEVIDLDTQRKLVQRATVGYTHEWTQGISVTEWVPPVQVRISFDLLRQERSGELTGEFSAVSVQPGIPRHIHTARMTLTGTRSRAEIAKQCALRSKSVTPADWDLMVEAACIRTIESFRAGDPAILMRDAIRPIGDAQLVPPLAHATLPEIIFGDGGTGKSEIALALAASIQSGESFMGMSVSSTRTVGYLDWEMTAWEHRKRLEAICGDDMPAIVYIPCAGPLREQVDRLRRVARERGIGYWIVDSIAPACGGEPEAAEVALGYFMALRTLGGGSLSVAHVKKEGKDADWKPFGSSFWHNMARSTWFAKKEQEANSPVLNLALYHRKSNLGPLLSPLAFTITFSEGRTKIVPTTVKPSSSLGGPMPLRLRMADLLSHGAMSYHEIAESLKVKLETVQKTAVRWPHVFVRLPADATGTLRIGLLEEDIA